jgi:predicted TIM-barrel fold metal-dependent hydrolase
MTQDQRRSEHPRYRGPVIDVHVHYDQASRDHAAEINNIGGLGSAISVWDCTWPPPAYTDDLAGWQALQPTLLRCHAPDFSQVGADSFEADTVAAVRTAAAAGCVGIKVWKNLGLWLTDTSRRRIALDDPRLEPLWESAAAAGLPILIHVGDPPEFWLPITEDNPRYDDVKDRPEWWYGVGDFPSLEQVQAEFEAVVQRHPATTFVGAHFGCFLQDLERWFRTYPNYHVDTAAAIAEIGKGEAAEARQLFLGWPDRILFGTDLARTREFEYPNFGPRRWDVEQFFDRHWRFFETGEEGLDHPIPEQLPWKVTGLNLPEHVLRALYHDNAARLYPLPTKALDAGHVA